MNFQLRADNRLVLRDERMTLELRDVRQTFQFVLTRPLYHADVVQIEASLGLLYDQQLRHPPGRLPPQPPRQPASQPS